MIDLTKAKLNCRCDGNEEDDLFLLWIAEADEVIQKDLDRQIIQDEADRLDESDILDNHWLDSARLIYVDYRYSRSPEGKPKAYWDLIKKFRIIGV